jgi:hypothetical protein
LRQQTEKWLNQQVNRILSKEYADLENARRQNIGSLKTMAKRGRKPGQKVNRTAVAYSVAAALQVLENGSNTQKADIAKRYPLFTISTDRERLSALNSLTARKLEALLRGGEEEETEAPVKKKAAVSSDGKVKRGPGRPPKAKLVEEDEDDSDEEEDEEETPAPKKRGRPAKVKPVAKKKSKKDDEDEEDLNSLMDSEDEDEEDEDDEEDSDEDESDEDDEEDEEEEPAPVKKKKAKK